jgi:hypothetical protein
MNTIRLFVFASFVGLIAGCNMQSPSQSPSVGPEIPGASIARGLVDDAYVAQRGVKPKGLVIGKIAPAQVFSGSKDVLVCANVREETIADTYDNAGRVVLPKGSLETVQYATLVRNYSDTGWGSGVFRSVVGNQIGRIDLEAFCAK